MSANTARRAHDQSVLVRVRMSTVDAIAQRLLQPPKQVLNSARPPLFSSGDGDILSPPIVSKDLSFFLGEKLLIDLRLDNWPEKLRNDG